MGLRSRVLKYVQDRRGEAPLSDVLLALGLGEATATRVLTAHKDLGVEKRDGRVWVYVKPIDWTP